ncbi:MAG: hypothetical protein HYU24_07585 [Candidatus Rokubacteria bacterium]|nr:hypothetical protein [Candidatus Rokubacteria bacterium]
MGGLALVLGLLTRYAALILALDLRLLGLGAPCQGTFGLSGREIFWLHPLKPLADLRGCGWKSPRG